MHKSAVIFGIASVVLGTLCGALIHQVRIERERLGALEQRNIQLENELAASRKLAASSRTFTQDTAVGPTVAAIPDPQHPSTAADAGKVLQSAVANFNAQTLEQLKNPEYRDALFEQQKQDIRERVGGVPAWVQISGAKKQELIELMANQQMELFELSAAAGGDPQAATQTMQPVRERHQLEIAQLLGPAANDRWNEYQDSRQARRLLSKVSSLGADTLAEDKIRPLAAAITKARQTAQDEMRQQGYPSEAAMTPEQGLALERRTNELARQSVSSILSPTQLQAFDDVQRQQLKQQEMLLKFRQSRSDASARVTASPQQ